HSTGHPPPRRAANVGSLLLTPQENECLFGYLGRKCATLCSAVVQVYVADRSCSWVKRCCGVACLVKDNPQRSYFIRVFDIKEGKTMFEQELYHSFSISSSRPYFISFAGDTCQIGLNFASEEEAKRFRAAINDLLNRRQRKTGHWKRTNRPHVMCRISWTRTLRHCIILHLFRFKVRKRNISLSGSLPDARVSLLTD
uniref:WH1 domain-containing protein n=1 Tax=Acanthochromis polyacanthus TaxID=80966 RepID=A0A3Q1FRE8_9TELE